MEFCPKKASAVTNHPLQIMMNFVDELESVCKRRIHTIDIGGGLSTDFERAPEPEDFGYNKYRRELELVAPGKTNIHFVLVWVFG